MMIKITYNKGVQVMVFKLIKLNPVHIFVNYKEFDMVNNADFMRGVSITYGTEVNTIRTYKDCVVFLLKRKYIAFCSLYHIKTILFYYIWIGGDPYPGYGFFCNRIELYL